MISHQLLIVAENSDQTLEEPPHQTKLSAGCILALLLKPLLEQDCLNLGGPTECTDVVDMGGGLTRIGGQGRLQ